jgi:energy-coupling factor transporter ATP-binding protein EcfA2
MIKSVKLQDATIFEEFEWDDLSRINLVIGENDTGKTNLLKMLYAVTRSLQESIRLDKAPSGPWKALLAEKLRQTFQPPSLDLGKIVRKGGNRLQVDCDFRGNTYARFAFTGSAKSEINDAEHAEGAPFPYTLFFPAKEILTTRDAIIEVRDRLKIAGFDDTYYDLAKALRSPESYEGLDSSLGAILDDLESLFQGHVEEEDGELVYRRGREKYGIAQAAEGIKKLEALRLLIRSRHIQEGSILFFDEPSANLHPELTLAFVELLYELGKTGVQVFIATHSYVVLKQFELLAREHDDRMPLCVLSPEEEGVSQSFADLSDRIPSNSIVDASVELLNKDLYLSAE